MCTAIAYQTKDLYFGRNLDLEYSYMEQVVVMPRNFPLNFRKVPAMNHHYAMIGMAYVQENYPLYYDATNEKGLSMAGLNFVGPAAFFPEVQGKDNVAPFELIPWILGQCENLQQARALLERMNILSESFSAELPIAHLHWMISDKSGSLVVESMADGLHIRENPVGVLTNNPPFDYQMTHLTDFMNLTPMEPENRFCSDLFLRTYCRGMGALGLPGDVSSASRFVRATFNKIHSKSGETEEESISQFFHILASVSMLRGCCDAGNGKYDLTIYSSCCNADKGIYYYTTYDNCAITGVDMHKTDLDATTITAYSLRKDMRILMEE